MSYCHGSKTRAKKKVLLKSYYYAKQNLSLTLSINNKHARNSKNNNPIMNTYIALIYRTIKMSQCFCLLPSTNLISKVKMQK